MISQYLPALRRVARAVLKYGARREIARIKNSTTGAEIGRAIEFALDPGFSPEEGITIDAIEAVRREMNASNDSFEMMDYGAGQKGQFADAAPGAKRTVTRNIGQLSMESSADPFWARVLYGLIRETRPTRCVEMGGLVGISSAYQAAALRVNARTGHNRPHLEVLEGDPTLAGVIRRNLSSLSLSEFAMIVQGPFSETLKQTVASGPPIDFAFVDGHHDGSATLQYFDQLRANLSPSAIVVFDDIRWSADMFGAWRTIESQPDIVVAVATRQFGIVRMGNPVASGVVRERYAVPLV